MINEKLKGFLYDGTFPLEFLKGSETVRAFPAIGVGACEIMTHTTSLAEYRINVGDVVARGPNGEIFVIDISETN